MISNANEMTGFFEIKAYLFYSFNFVFQLILKENMVKYFMLIRSIEHNLYIQNRDKNKKVHVASSTWN